MTSRIDSARDVSVVLAAFNEAPSIERVVRESAASSPRILEVIVADDGSTDGTAERAEAAGARVLRLGRRQGKGTAVRAGIAAARGEVLVYLDADGQDDPREIPLLLGALPGRDLVTGSRFLGRFGPGAITRFNHAGNRFLTWVVNVLFGTRLTDTQAGFRAVRRAALDGVALSAERFDIEVDVLLGVLRAGGRVDEVPVSRAARDHGKSRLRSIPDGARILRRIVAQRTSPVADRAAPHDRA
jgi:glycosyltransferase involved in cell wall biosynthesis